jgi:hypothetical protein
VAALTYKAMPESYRGRARGLAPACDAPQGDKRAIADSEPAILPDKIVQRGVFHGHDTAKRRRRISLRTMRPAKINSQFAALDLAPMADIQAWHDSCSSASVNGHRGHLLTVASKPTIPGVLGAIE